MFALFSVSAQLAFIALWCFVLAVVALEIHVYRHDHLDTLRRARAIMRAWLGPIRWPRLRVIVRWPRWQREAERRDRLAKIAAPGLYRRPVH